MSASASAAALAESPLSPRVAEPAATTPGSAPSPAGPGRSEVRRSDSPVEANRPRRFGAGLGRSGLKKASSAAADGAAADPSARFRQEVETQSDKVNAFYLATLTSLREQLDFYLPRVGAHALPRVPSVPSDENFSDAKLGVPTPGGVSTQVGGETESAPGGGGARAASEPAACRASSSDDGGPAPLKAGIPERGPIPLRRDTTISTPPTGLASARETKAGESKEGESKEGESKEGERSARAAGDRVAKAAAAAEGGTDTEGGKEAKGSTHDRSSLRRALAQLYR